MLGSWFGMFIVPVVFILFCDLFALLVVVFWVRWCLFGLVWCFGVEVFLVFGGMLCFYLCLVVFVWVCVFLFS